MVEVSQEDYVKLVDNQKSVKVIKKMDLTATDKEGLRVGTRTDGKKYSVRTHRNSFIMPSDWTPFMNALKSERAKLTAETLIQLGGRINEVRNIEERDVDFERNTIRLRVTKCKATKGEEVGKPRTIPVNSIFIKKLKKHFAALPPGSKIGILSTPGFNINMKKALKKIEHPEPHMLSAHNIRKSHGNWLKILGNLRIMNIDASEICLRLGHDYNTFLAHYGSSSVFDSKDVQIAKNILGDLYS